MQFRIPRSLAPLALVLAVAACRPAAGPVATLSPSERLSLNERRASDPRASAADLGQMAATAWLVTGDAAQAEGWVTKALAKDPNEPLALFTRFAIRREAVDEAGATEAALAIVQHDPKNALAELAAVRLQEFSQVSPAIDSRIEEGLSALDSASAGLSGAAAFRAREALLSVRDGRNDDAALAKSRASMGIVPAWTLVGPLGAYRLRETSAPSPFDDPAYVLAATYPAAVGTVAPRTMPTPGGTLSLEAEPWRGDVFEALTEMDVQKSGTHLVEMRGASEATVWVDGVKVLERRTLPRRAPDRSWAAVELPGGRHRVRVRFTRAESSWVALAFPRADGEPSQLAFTPVEVGAKAPAVTAKAASVPGGAASAIEADLKADPSNPTLAWENVLAHLLDDSEAARKVLPELVAAAGESPSVRSLRMDLTSIDPDMPRANQASAVMRDVDAILEKFPSWPRAHLLKFDHERQDKRFDEASARLGTLGRLLGEKNARLAMMRARFAQDRGDVAAARRYSEQALELDPGRCDALDFRSDLARRDDEVEVSNRLVPLLASCPGGPGVVAGYDRSRGKLAEAKILLAQLVARMPSSLAARQSLADVMVSMGDLKGAIAQLEPLNACWPRRPDALRRQAQLADLAGDPATAAKLRAKAADIDASDVSLARAVALEKGSEALAWAARDGRDVIANFKKAGFRANAPAVQVLDLGAMELQQDGSMLERVHSIVQVLDKRGIDKYGEVSLPSDAQALSVRTIKADGTVLDAEIISGKDSISLPNLEPGDFAEYEFLRASGPRPASMPGFSGGQFFFDGGEVPFYESTYVVRVPANMPVEVDSHGMEPAGEPVRHGEWLEYARTRHGTEPFLREPVSVSDGEVMPWVEVGAGARQDEAMLQMADWLPLRTRPSGEVDELVRGTRSLAPAERVREIVKRVREAVKGDSAATDWSESPAGILAKGRGNRMLVLKAALEAAGIPSHVVAIRPYSANPYPFRFPRPDLYNMVVLRIEPSGAPVTWMDFGLRQAPLGKLPVETSGADAFVLPAPGEKLERLTMPAIDPSQDRTDATLELALDAQGTLTGTLAQTAYGFDAAGVRRRLEQMSLPDLKKQQERMLSATFRGVTLVDLAIEDSGDPEKPLVARSTIRVPRFGQRPDGSVAIPATFGPQMLGPRYLGRADRKTPLLLPQDDLSHAKVTLKLPPNATAKVPAPVIVDAPFGKFASTWVASGSELVLEESMLLRRGRVAPDQYPAFQKFATAVDQAQGREIPLALAK